jgi:hypothetical protein
MAEPSSAVLIAVAATVDAMAVRARHRAWGTLAVRPGMLARSRAR